MTFPDEGVVPGDVDEYESIRLFIERAATLTPEFSLGSEDLDTVARLCRRLDGLPLAIEMAAARTDVLALGEILGRLDDHLSAVADRSRPARHATLDIAIRWSYGLLDDVERQLLRHLSVFRGGFNLEAAEDICECGETEGRTVVELIARLVNKSLLSAHTPGDGPTRYSMLETIRHFTHGRLVEAGEESEVRNLHAHHFLRVAEEAEPNLQASDQRRWLDRLEADRDNLRTAMDWCARSGLVEAGLRIGAALQWFWKMHGYAIKGAERIEGLLADTSGVAPNVKARALIAAGALRSSHDVDKAARLLEGGLSAAETAGDRSLQAWARGWLGLVARIRNQLEESRHHLEQALALTGEKGQPGITSFLLGHMAVLAREQGDLEEAADLHSRCLQLDRETGNGQDEAWNLAGPGLVYLYQGEPIRAEPFLQRSLAVHRQLGFTFEIVTLLALQGVAACRRGAAHTVPAVLHEAEVLAEDLGEDRLTELVIKAWATLAVARGEFDRGAELFGSADALRARTGQVRGMFQRLFEADMEKSESALEEDALAAASERRRLLAAQS